LPIGKAKIDASICALEVLRDCEYLTLHQNQASARSIEVRSDPYLDATKVRYLKVQVAGLQWQSWWMGRCGWWTRHVPDPSGIAGLAE